MKENKLIQYSIVFIAVVILGIILKELAGILRPLMIAFFITVLSIPLYNFAKRKKIPGWIPILSILFLLLISFYFIGGLLSSEIVRFKINSINYQDQITSAVTLITANTNIDFSLFNINTILQSQAGNKFITNSVSTIGNIFIELALAIIFAIFMIPAYRKTMEKMTTRNKKLYKTLHKIQANIIKYLHTKTIISLGTAITSAIVLTLFNSDFIWTLSIIIFLFNFVPSVGSTVAVLLASALYALKFGLGIKLFIFIGILIIIQQIWGTFIEPKHAGKQLQLSPLLILISLFFWGWLWGVGGMIISVPILTVVKISLEHFKSTKHLAEYMQ